MGFGTIVDVKYHLRGRGGCSAPFVPASALTPFYVWHEGGSWLGS